MDLRSHVFVDDRHTKLGGEFSVHYLLSERRFELVHHTFEGRRGWLIHLLFYPHKFGQQFFKLDIDFGFAVMI